MYLRRNLQGFRTNNFYKNLIIFKTLSTMQNEKN